MNKCDVFLNVELLHLKSASFVVHSFFVFPYFMELVILRKVHAGRASGKHFHYFVRL